MMVYVKFIPQAKSRLVIQVTLKTKKLEPKLTAPGNQAKICIITLYEGGRSLLIDYTKIV